MGIILRELLEIELMHWIESLSQAQVMAIFKKSKVTNVLENLQGFENEICRR